jgi:hypothetical protein
MFQLPHKLSVLAEMALDDVVKVEQLNGFVIDMSEFIIDGGEVCSVCAAGAVMVQRLGATKSNTTEDFGLDNKRALWAIDALRLGLVGKAKQRLTMGNPPIDNAADADHWLDRDLPEYDADCSDWHEAMQVLIDDLREAGL